MQKLNKTRRKHKTNNKNRQKHKQTLKLKEQHKTNRHTGSPALDPTRKINISKGLAGRYMFLCVFCFAVFLRVVRFVSVCTCAFSIVNAKA